tara:strand:+ start:73 stop:828 length:756 start_codon:yes stop_codon:yes gene_type:complete
MKNKMVVANWKMNLNYKDGIHLLNDISNKFQFKTESKVIIAASHIHLHEAVKLSQLNSQINIAAQNCSAYDSGAYTSEVSAKMINSCGVEYVILGHSECRDNLKEDNYLLMQKVSQALSNNLHVIFCCGETLEQREKNIHFKWIQKQLSESLFHLFSEDMSKIHIAYEPIWAIGTGVTASVNQAQEMHSYIRSIIAKKYGKIVSDNISILYGGSCNASNASELFSQADIDGGLIGGASLTADSFISIIKSF